MVKNYHQRSAQLFRFSAALLSGGRGSPARTASQPSTAPAPAPAPAPAAAVSTPAPSAAAACTNELEAQNRAAAAAAAQHAALERRRLRALGDGAEQLFPDDGDAFSFGGGPVLDDGDPLDEKDTFTVKEVVDKRKGDGATEYRVRWEGFGAKDDTWEPVHHLGGSTLAIRSYEQRAAEQATRAAAANIAASAGSAGRPPSSPPPRRLAGSKKSSLPPGWHTPQRTIEKKHR